MQLSNLPAWVAKIFGQSATSTYIRTLPLTTSDPSAASFDLGFPPQTFANESAGGTPPDGRDFNGVLNHLDSFAYWYGMGGSFPWNVNVATAGGYPKGATVLAAAGGGVKWTSSTDNNTTNPDAGGAGWVASGPTISGVDATTGISWRTWVETDGKRGVRMSGLLSFSSESNQSVNWSSLFTLASVADYGVSTIIPYASAAYDQGAQIIGTPSTSALSVQMQQYGGGTWSWPLTARWFVEGKLTS